MKKSAIQLGNRYEIKLGKNTSTVKVASFDEEHGTWLCETDSGKTLRVKDAARFLKEVKPKEKKSLREIIESKGVTIIPRGRRATKTMRDLDDPTLTRKYHVKDNGVVVLEDDEPVKRMGPKPNGAMSVLDAAHKVLVEEGRPMKVLEIMEAALARQYCVVGGKTPFNTFNGGIRNEIAKKGKKSRFVWVDKGQFAAR
jgi:hypothetical protein